jgi:hypothetical protein
VQRPWPSLQWHDVLRCKGFTCSTCNSNRRIDVVKIFSSFFL